MTKFKVGDRVCCLMNGWGSVIEKWSTERNTHYITVKFPKTKMCNYNETMNYTSDGKLLFNDFFPILFTEDEIKQMWQISVFESLKDYK